MTKNTIIVIQGGPKQGKSSTIRKISEIFRNTPDATEIRYPKRRVDVKSIFTINDVLIGIEGQGDPNSSLENSLNEFYDNGCHIIICSSRNYGSTFNAVKKIASAGNYQIIRAANYRSAKDHDRLNSISANHLVALIKPLLSKDKSSQPNPETLLEKILRKLRHQGYCQVLGYNRFNYIRETKSAVYLSRENGKDTRVPFEKVKIGIANYQQKVDDYDGTPSTLREYRLTHVTSPIFALLHLLNKDDYRD